MSQPALFPQPIALAHLESHLWEAANILRGSPVDCTDWKGYILPLLFFKRICDVWDEEYEDAFNTYGEDYADEHRFQVPPVMTFTESNTVESLIVDLLCSPQPVVSRAQREEQARHLPGSSQLPGRLEWSDSCTSPNRTPSNS